MLFLGIDYSKLSKKWKNIRDSTNKKRQGKTKGAISNNLLFLLPYLKAKDNNLQVDSNQCMDQRSKISIQYVTASQSTADNEFLIRDDTSQDILESQDPAASQDVIESQNKNANLKFQPLPAWISRIKTQDQLERNLLIKKKSIMLKLKKRLNNNLHQACRRWTPTFQENVNQQLI